MKKKSSPERAALLEGMSAEAYIAITEAEFATSPWRQTQEHKNATARSMKASHAKRKAKSS